MENLENLEQLLMEINEYTPKYSKKLLKPENEEIYRFLSEIFFGNQMKKIKRFIGDMLLTIMKFRIFVKEKI